MKLINLLLTLFICISCSVKDNAPINDSHLKKKDQIKDEDVVTSSDENLDPKGDEDSDLIPNKFDKNPRSVDTTKLAISGDVDLTVEFNLIRKSDDDRVLIKYSINDITPVSSIFKQIKRNEYYRTTGIDYSSLPPVNFINPGMIVGKFDLDQIGDLERKLSNYKALGYELESDSGKLNLSHSISINNNLLNNFEKVENITLNAYTFSRYKKTPLASALVKNDDGTSYVMGSNPTANRFLTIFLKTPAQYIVDLIRGYQEIIIEVDSFSITFDEESTINNSNFKEHFLSNFFVGIISNEDDTEIIFSKEENYASFLDLLMEKSEPPSIDNFGKVTKFKQMVNEWPNFVDYRSIPSKIYDLKTWIYYSNNDDDISSPTSNGKVHYLAYSKIGNIAKEGLVYSSIKMSLSITQNGLNEIDKNLFQSKKGEITRVQIYPRFRDYTFAEREVNSKTWSYVTGCGWAIQWHCKRVFKPCPVAPPATEEPSGRRCEYEWKAQKAWEGGRPTNPTAADIINVEKYISSATSWCHGGTCLNNGTKPCVSCGRPDITKEVNKKSCVAIFHDPKQSGVFNFTKDNNDLDSEVNFLVNNKSPDISLINNASIYSASGALEYYFVEIDNQDVLEANSSSLISISMAKLGQNYTKSMGHQSNDCNETHNNIPEKNNVSKLVGREVYFDIEVSRLVYDDPTVRSIDENI